MHAYIYGHIHTYTYMYMYIDRCTYEHVMCTDIYVHVRDSGLDLISGLDHFYTEVVKNLQVVPFSLGSG